MSLEGLDRERSRTEFTSQCTNASGDSQNRDYTKSKLKGNWGDGALFQNLVSNIILVRNQFMLFIPARTIPNFGQIWVFTPTVIRDDKAKGHHKFSLSDGDFR